MIAVALKGLLGRKFRATLTAFAIVLGVAMVSGSFILTDTIGKSFDRIYGESYKSTDVVISSKDTQNGGEAPAFSADVLRKVERLPGVADAAGSIEDEARLVDKNGKLIAGRDDSYAVSVDASADRRFNPLRLVRGQWPRGDGQIAIDKATAKKKQFETGETIGVVVDGPRRDYRITGIVQYGSVSSIGGATIAAFDLATAQRIFGKRDQLDVIRVAAEPGVSPAQLTAEIRPLLPATAEVKSASAQAASESKDTKTGLNIIRYILLAFGGIALFVGSFVIANTLSITVAQRMRELATLRTIGASRRQVLGSVVLEAAIVGVVASLAGHFLGLGLAKALNGLLAAVGIDLPQGGLVFATQTVIVSLVVGTVIAIKTRLVSLGGGVLLLFIGVTLVAPRLVRPLAALLGSPGARFGGAAGKLACDNATRNPSRTASTAAALMIGLALVTFVAVLGQGLRSSFTDSVDELFVADYALTAGNNPLNAEVARAAENVPRVEVVSGIRSGDGKLFGKSVQVNGVDANLSKVVHMTWYRGSGDVPAQLGRDGAFVNQDYAEDHSLVVGSRLQLATASGKIVRLRVKGIFEEPNGGSPFGDVSISTATFDRSFAEHENEFTFVNVRGSTTSENTASLERTLNAYPEAEVQTRDEFKKGQLALFSKLLNVLYALLGLSVIVSLFGIVNTLVLSVFERTRELGMLRAIGMTRRQVRRMIRHESIVTALIGAALGIGVGVFLAGLVTVALSDQGFVFAVPYVALAALVTAAIAAGMLAAVLPARRASRLNVLEALQFE